MPRPKAVTMHRTPRTVPCAVCIPSRPQKLQANGGRKTGLRPVRSPVCHGWLDGNGVWCHALAVRLDSNQLQTIRDEVWQLDPTADVYLYGSRVDDAAKGGDIDLLVVSDHLGFREVLKLRQAILDRIGWQQLDLVVRRRDQADDPLAAMVLETGIKL